MEDWQNPHQYSVFGSVPQKCSHSPFFSFLDDKKQGNSDHIDRIDLIELFIQVFGKHKIEVLLADREFIGDLWLNWLEEQRISYVMRIKEAGQYISNSRGIMVKAVDLLRPPDLSNTPQNFFYTQ